ncbi:hypothetical protein LCGC14_2099590 [marine sediment metagenome]|uniref:Uncharacterized protein n=1 Tax=marine sediment metagenome TaxID=412755 RepID=A0A0F9H6S1_9ZZZZ
MKQVHFQSRTHLILWLEKTCPRPAIVRALYEGQVEFFGGFNPVPPTEHPGWIIRVTSAHGKIRYVAVIAYRDHYGVRILRDVPWGNWCGIKSQGGPPYVGVVMRNQLLYSGDHPNEYKKLWEIWNDR